MIERAPDSRVLREKVAGHQERFAGYVRELIARHPEVRVADEDTAARLVVSVAELNVHHLIADPDPIDPVRLEDELVAMITGYLAGRR